MNFWFEAALRSYFAFGASFWAQAKVGAQRRATLTSAAKRNMESSKYLVLASIQHWRAIRIGVRRRARGHRHESHRADYRSRDRQAKVPPPLRRRSPRRRR